MNSKTNALTIPVFSFVPTKYGKLTKEKGGKIFLGILVFLAVIFAIKTVMALSTFNDVAEEFNKGCPDFSLRSGRFSIEEEYMLEEEGVFLSVTDKNAGMSVAELSEYVNSAKEPVISAISIGSDRMTVYSGGQYQSVDFKDISNYSIDKATLVDVFIPSVKPIIIIAMIIGLFLYIGLYYLAAVIMQLVALIAQSVFDKKLDYKKRFRLTVLAKFPCYVLFFVLSLFSINLSFLIQVLIVAVYIFACVFFYKEDEDNAIETAYTEE